MMRKIHIILTAVVAVMAFAAVSPVKLSAQAQITTKKVKVEDFSEKITKVVLSGNEFFDATIKEEIRSRWTISPYEFCTLDDFNRLKTNPEYYFLIRVKGQFRKEQAPGIEFLTILKGGPEAGEGIDKMLDLITFPYSAADFPTGRETVFLPAIIDIIQASVSSFVETGISTNISLRAQSDNLPEIKGKRVLLAREDMSAEVTPVTERLYFKDGIEMTDADTADESVLENVPGTVVSYTVCPENAHPGSYCYKMLIDIENNELCYFRRHKITRRTGPGFLVEDIKRIASANE